MSPSDREDERVRFGREPAGLEEQRFLEEQVPGADEYPTPRVGVLPSTVMRRGDMVIRLSFGVAGPVAADREGEVA